MPNTMVYDGDGRRVKKQDSAGTAKYIWDMQNILGETDQMDVSQVVYTLHPQLYGSLISQMRASTSFFHFDALGCTEQLTDNSGGVTDSYIYKAFGVSQSSVGTSLNPYRYVGAQGYYFDADPVQYLLRARHFDPAIGRFLSVDPIAVDSGDLNWYRYVANNPVNYIDPSGMAVGVTCPISVLSHGEKCDLGRLEASPIWYHKRRGKPLRNNQGANGVGISLHYLRPKGGFLGCSPCCKTWKWIQVIFTNDPVPGRKSPYVDNDMSRRGTPFYGDVYLGGPPNRRAADYPPGDDNPASLASIYDRVYRTDAQLARLKVNIYIWIASACIVCLRRALPKPNQPDLIMSCIKWGFFRKKTGNVWGDAQAIGPKCVETKDLSKGFQKALDEDNAGLTYKKGQEWTF